MGPVFRGQEKGKLSYRMGPGAGHDSTVVTSHGCGDEGRELWLRGVHLRDVMDGEGATLQRFVPGGQLGGPQAEQS